MPETPDSVGAGVAVKAPIASLEALETIALELLVDDDTQPNEAREEAEAILARRARESVTPIVLDASDEAGAKLALVQAIAAAMADAHRVTKDRTNSEGGGYKFASVESMLKAVRVPLFARGVLLMPHPRGWSEAAMTAKSGNTGTVVDLVIDFEFTNGAASYRVEGWHGQGVDYSDKAGSKAYTAALKTFVRTAWLLPAETEEREPDAGNPEGYRRGAGAVAPPAWAAPADQNAKAKLMEVLGPIIGHTGTARKYAAQLTEAAGGQFPAVVAHWLAALPSWIDAGAQAAEDATAQAERRAQDKRAEAPDAPAPEPEPQAPPAEPDPDLEDNSGWPCGARRQGLECVKPAGHAHRGDPDHATATGTFPDDELVSYGPAPGQATMDGPAVGSVPMPALPEDADDAAIARALLEIGCTCSDPLGDPPTLDTLNCPVEGHGIPW